MRFISEIKDISSEKFSRAQDFSNALSAQSATDTPDERNYWNFVDRFMKKFTTADGRIIGTTINMTSDQAIKHLQSLFAVNEEAAKDALRALSVSDRAELCRLVISAKDISAGVKAALTSSLFETYPLQQNGVQKLKAIRDKIINNKKDLFASLTKAVDTKKPVTLSTNISALGTEKYQAVIDVLTNKFTAAFGCHPKEVLVQPKVATLIKDPKLSQAGGYNASTGELLIAETLNSTLEDILRTFYHEMIHCWQFKRDQDFVAKAPSITNEIVKNYSDLLMEAVSMQRVNNKIYYDNDVVINIPGEAEAYREEDALIAGLGKMLPKSPQDTFPDPNLRQRAPQPTIS
ncbi:MAG: hypothetical protein V4691_01025 [Pseudomonadota bacterium]